MDSAFAVAPPFAQASGWTHAPSIAAPLGTARIPQQSETSTGSRTSGSSLGMFAVGSALVYKVRKAQKQAKARKARKAFAASSKVQLKAVEIAEPLVASEVDFKKLDGYSLGELEELYIDSLWSYYREGKPLMSDIEFDSLKGNLYARDSKFPTLRQTEVAFVEACIANYRGAPVVSDAEFQRLENEVKDSGRRKDITAFLLFERGEQLLSHEQYVEMKGEVAKLGMTAVSIEDCNLAQLEEMYVDAIWAFYNDGRKILTDEQYDKLQEELSWQGSGFPSLTKQQVLFVKASLSYYRGQPILNDDEWRDLKAEMNQNERNSEITAFLLYTKGQQELDPKTFDEMAESMQRLGVDVLKGGTAKREILLSKSSDTLSSDVGKALQMYGALGAIPMVLSFVLVWTIGVFVALNFVQGATWDLVVSQYTLPLLGGGGILGVGLSLQLINYLDLQNPEVLSSTCPSCGASVSAFVGGAEVPDQIEAKCGSCGTPMIWGVKEKRILKAGVGAKFAADIPTYEWTEAWVQIREAVFAKSEQQRELGFIDPKLTFSIWDKDNSGTINMTEMRKAFKTLKIDISNKDLELLFREADVNGDGEIDYSEFYNMWVAAGKGGDGKVSQEYLKKSMNNLFRN